MNAGSLRGKPVVSVANAAKIGTVHDLVLNPEAERLVAVRIKPAPEGVVRTIAATDLTIGRDAVTVREFRSVPEEELTGVEGTVDRSKLLGTNVLTHGGDLLGKVAEVEIDPSDFRITGYEVSAGPFADLFGRKKMLPSGKGIRYGSNMLLVPDNLAAGAEAKKAA